MAGVNVSEILVGKCTVTIDSVDVGYTQGGVTLRAQKDKLDVEADQAAGIVKKPTTLERMFVVFTMLQSSLSNFLLAFDEPAAGTGGSGTLDFGSADPATIEHTVAVTGPNASGAGLRTYTFYRAVRVENAETVVGNRAAVQQLPVTLELLKDANGKFGCYTDA